MDPLFSVRTISKGIVLTLAVSTFCWHLFMIFPYLGERQREKRGKRPGWGGVGGEAAYMEA